MYQSFKSNPLSSLLLMQYRPISLPYLPASCASCGGGSMLCRTSGRKGCWTMIQQGISRQRRDMRWLRDSVVIHSQCPWCLPAGTSCYSVPWGTLTRSIFGYHSASWHWGSIDPLGSIATVRDCSGVSVRPWTPAWQNLRLICSLLTARTS